MCGVYHPLAALVKFHQRWPFNLDCLPTHAYLVGGSVRDVLMGRWVSHLDLDFVLPEGAIQVASQIARYHQAGFVLLDQVRQIARVVFANATADFALQVGPTLEADLQRRDFTINAIAYNPHAQELFDPLGGYRDLQNRQLQMVSAENLEEDPLRLLRAYRQAAQLNFSLEASTQARIRELAPLLKGVAAERVQTELRYLLSSNQSTTWVTAAWQDQVLQDWLTHTDAGRLQHFSALHQATCCLEEHLPGFTDTLQVRVHDSTFAPKRCIPLPDQRLTTGQHSPEHHEDRNLFLVAKLASLVSQDPEIAEWELAKLKFSRAEIRAVGILLRSLPKLQRHHQPLSLKAQYQLFQDVGLIFPALAIFAVGAGVPLAAMLPLVQRFLDPQDVVAHPKTLVTGNDLMQGLDLNAGPQIGQLLAAIQLAQAEGDVKTFEQAMAFSRTWLENTNL